MIEHSFYQMLNLVQILYIHCIRHVGSRTGRLGLLVLVTAPWWLRSKFPVHSFSKNYLQKDPWTLINVLYRLKKYQYLFYKHFLLHGLNITLAVRGDDRQLADRLFFRVYWLGLNAACKQKRPPPGLCVFRLIVSSAYMSIDVLEFFLQTLVKRHYMSQTRMLQVQQVLMLSTTMPALTLLGHIQPMVAVFSWMLNFLQRHKEMINTGLITLFWLLGRDVLWRAAT